MTDFMPDSPKAVSLKNSRSEHFIFQRISLISNTVAAVIPGCKHMGSSFYGNAKLPVIVRLGILVKSHDFHMALTLSSHTLTDFVMESGL